MSRIHKFLPTLNRREGWVALAMLCMMGVVVAWSLLGPQIPASAIPTAHEFADHRQLIGVRNALDVLSNIPFAILGLAGLFMLARGIRPLVTTIEPGNTAFSRFSAAVFFIGLLTAFAGSTCYHLYLDDLHLMFDRIGMAFAFAGLVGLAASDRVSLRSAPIICLMWLAGGILSAIVWKISGDLRPWVVVQFGGMALVFALACVPSTAVSDWRSHRPLLPLFSVIAIYVIAKIFEIQDQRIFLESLELVSGHTLKHLIASLAAAPIIYYMHREGRSLGHNESAPAQATTIEAALSCVAHQKCV